MSDHLAKEDVDAVLTETLSPWLSSLTLHDDGPHWTTALDTLFKGSRMMSAMGFPGHGRMVLNAARDVLEMHRNDRSIPVKLLDALFTNVEGGAKLVPRDPRPHNELDDLLSSTDDMWAFLLQTCAHTRGSTDTIPKNEDEDRMRRLDSAFRQEYVGNAADIFYECLPVYEELYSTSQDFYGRIIPIVQGSGTGKSRLIEQLKRKFPTTSVCFRAGDHPTLGWPPRDVGRSFFNDLDDSFKAEEKAAAFLGAWADVMSDTAPADSSGEAALKSWREAWDMGSPDDRESAPRRRRFQAVKEKTVELLREKKDELVAERARLKLNQEGMKLEQEMLTFGGWHFNVFSLLTRKSFERLGKTIKGLGYDKVLFALDECTELNGPPSTDTENDRRPRGEISLIAFQRIMKAADGCIPEGVTFWFGLLDTNSAILEITGTGPDAPSFRLTKDYRPLPIWSYLGFDQMCKLFKLGRAVDSLLIRFLIMYGRPLWSTLGWRLDAVEAAKKKLLYDDEFKPNKLEHVFAVFSHRVLLDLAGNEQASRLAIESLRRHMRILMTVVNGIAITKAPSEPMLSVAAAYTLNMDAKAYDTALAALIREISEKGGVLEKGRHGELCGRLLLTIARDKATLPNGGSFVLDAPKTLPRILPVRLSSFLTTLLGEKLGFKDQPELIGTAEQLLADVNERWVNFTHFVQAECELDTITPEDLYDLWCRTAAVQCTFNQGVIDLLIPDYRGNLNDPFDINNLGYTVVQIKEAKSAVQGYVVKGLAGPIIKSDNRRYKPSKYVALMLDLGTFVSMSHGARSDLEFAKPEWPGPRKSNHKWKGYMKTDDMEEERYCLNIRGHGSDVYPVVNKVPSFNEMFELISDPTTFPKAEEYMGDCTDHFKVFEKLRATQAPDTIQVLGWAKEEEMLDKKFGDRL